MSTSINMHNVAKVEVSSTRQMDSSTGSFNSREIIVTFDDGTTQQIDLFNRNDTLPMEIN
jgi:hypothetical protein